MKKTTGITERPSFQTGPTPPGPARFSVPVTRIALMALLVAGCLFLIWYCHARLGIGTVFTHLYGRGFCPAELALPDGRSGGFGLFSLRERLQSLGGSLESSSASGEGCRLVLTCPESGLALERDPQDPLRV